MKILFLFFVLSLSSVAFAQHEGMQMPMPPAQKPSKPMDMGQPEKMREETHDETLVSSTLAHTTSDTSAQPLSISAPMLMKELGKWRFMFHANAFVLGQQQSGPRGYDKFFSSNWFMPM